MLLLAVFTIYLRDVLTLRKLILTIFIFHFLGQGVRIILGFTGKILLLEIIFISILTNFHLESDLKV